MSDEQTGHDDSDPGDETGAPREGPGAGDTGAPSGAPPPSADVSGDGPPSEPASEEPSSEPSSEPPSEDTLPHDVPVGAEAPPVAGRSGGYRVRGTAPPPPPPPAPAGPAAPPSETTAGVPGGETSGDRTGPATGAPARVRRGVGERRWLVVVVAALIGALVGGGVAAGVVIADDEEPPGVVERPDDGSANSSVIEVADDVQSILARIEPAVVSVRTRSLDLNMFLEPVPSEGAGTGFVIDSDGVIVTNNHVIQGAQRIEVVLANGDTEQARVLGRDPEHDIAVLEIDRSGLETASLGDSDQLEVGDDVIAIGNALALGGGPTVTRGIISATDRTLAAPGGLRLESMVQTDAAINPGNSGGPLVNAVGEVVAINTAIVQGAENIGFAIAVNAVKPVIDDLREGRPISRPFLGVQTITIDEQVARQFGIETDEGALVLEVVPGSAAESAGIQRGDVIVEIAGDEVTSSQEVASLVRDHEPGEEVEVVVVRGGDRETLTATLGERTVGG